MSKDDQIKVKIKELLELYGLDEDYVDDFKRTADNIINIYKNPMDIWRD